jgi:hypothetical protein
MSITRSILIKSFVKPFYRQHAGLFAFLFVIMFGVVGVLDGAKFTDYHFFLIQGILRNPFLFLLILIIWLLYAKKSEQFILNILRRPGFSFLQMLSVLDIRKLYSLLIRIQFLLFLPIVFYVLIIFAAGIFLHAYTGCIIILVYIILLIQISVHWYMYVIQNPGVSPTVISFKFPFKIRETPYWSFFIRYIGRDKKLFFVAIKIYSCAVLYLMVVNQTQVEYDLRMILIFFSLGILGHGLLIHQLRDMEETRLAFYRTIPRSLLNRFIQYGLIYFILLLPEFITISLLTPYYLHFRDAFLFALFSYSLLLFLNSLLFVQFFRMKDYLKIILCIFLLIYFCVLTVSIPLLCFIFFLSSIVIFFGRYYQFERKNLLL